MKVKVFSLSYQAELGGFDSSEVEIFGEEVEILSVQEHFFLHQSLPRLVLVMTYQEEQGPMRSSSGGSRLGAGSKSREQATTASQMSSEEKTMFETIRRWRAKQAKEDGIPAFAILNNESLLDVVKRRPQTKTALLGVQGIGKASIERYAETLTSFFRPPTETSAALVTQDEPTKEATP